MHVKEIMEILKYRLADNVGENISIRILNEWEKWVWFFIKFTFLVISVDNTVEKISPKYK